jgi:hypothetical protein
MKSQYNQGDMLQYHHRDGSTQLLVITEVSSDTYEVFWIGPPYCTGRKGINIHDFSTLDDTDLLTLLARGQQ